MRPLSSRSWHIIGWLVLLCLAGLYSTAYAQAATLVFQVATTSADGKTLTPKISWSTSPAASSCTASGDWSGTKAATGVETLAAVNSSKSYTMVCNWAGDTTATVTWSNPTTNADGTPLTNLQGTRILWGTSAANLDQTFYNEDAAATKWVSPTLAAGTWYFGVRSYNSLGLESATTTPVSKVITAAASQSRTATIGFSVPSSPSGVAVK